MSASDGTRYVAKSGNDSNDGLSWATAKLTIQAAINSLSGPGTIEVGNGVYEESLSLKTAGTRIVGRGAYVGGTGTVVSSPGDTTSTVTISSEWCHLENLLLRGHSQTASAIVLSIGGKGHAGEAAHHTSLDYVQVEGTPGVFYSGEPHDLAHTITAGTGIQVVNAEWGSAREVRVTLCKKGIFYPSKSEDSLIQDTGAGYTWLQLHCDTNYQDLVMKGGGGCAFLRSKFVSGTQTAVPTVEIGEGEVEGGWLNSFISCDWEEGLEGQSVVVKGDLNSFVSCNDSRQVTWTISGNWNTLQSMHVTEKLYVTGKGNTLIGCAGNIIRVTGDRNLLRNCIAHFTIEGEKNVFDNFFGYDVTGSGIAEGFYGKAPIAKPKPGAGEAELRTALRNLGLIE